MRGVALAALALVAVLVSAAAARSPETRPWREVLRQHVSRRGEVAYREVAREGRDRIVAYLRSAAEVRLQDLSWDESVALHLNAYNAAVVLGIADGHLPDTLAGRARLYHWVRVDVGGEVYTLGELEARIAGFAARDPRIYFALCNGTRRAPRLASQAFSPARLDAQLAWVTRLFVRDPERTVYDRGRKRLVLSPLFERGRADFERAAGSIEAFLAAHVKDEDLARDLLKRAVEVEFHPEDWRSNAAPEEDPAPSGMPAPAPKRRPAVPPP